MNLNTDFKYCYLASNGFMFYTSSLEGLEHAHLFASNNKQLNKLLELKELDAPILTKQDWVSDKKYSHYSFEIK